MGNATFEQADFSGGIYRGRRAPANAVYDALNGLIDDEGQLFKRGGSTFKSNANAGSTLLGLWDGQTLAGARTVFWGASNIYALSGDDATPVTVALVTMNLGP